jgi:alkylation response protein AidB-like acyl-CoA dehydrogenase
MDFELSDDQLALQEAASALLDGESPTTRVREVMASDSHLDGELWAAMAEQGWLAIEDTGDEGLGLGLVEIAVLCEELGRHVAPVPFLGTVLARGALADAAGVAQAALGGADVATWTQRLGTGEAVGALAWSRRPGQVRAATASDGQWRLTGRADPVVYGPAADVVVVWAADDGAGGGGLFAVAQSAGARPAPESAMDRTRSLAWLDLVDTPAVRLGDGDAADHLLDRAATVLGAEMLGAAQRVLEMTVEYAKDRVQFGRPIGSFQAVKHRCADMLVDVEGMRSSAYYAAWAVGAGDAEARSAASAAKVWCSDAARRVMASGLQVHGGIGFTWEHDLHLFLKRSELDQVSFGDATFHRDRLVSILRPRAEAASPVL